MPLAITWTHRWFGSASLTRDIGLVSVGSIWIALMAQLSIPLPFTPIPITGQTWAVLLVGAALGSTRGVLSVLLYLLEGIIGLPVFAGGGLGIATIFGPRGGYLAGFVVSAWVMGKLAEKNLDRRLGSAFCIFLVGEVIIFTLGILWLSQFVGTSRAVAAGLLPFLPGEAIKIALATLLFPSLWKTVEHQPSSLPKTP